MARSRRRGDGCGHAGLSHRHCGERTGRSVVVGSCRADPGLVGNCDRAGHPLLAGVTRPARGAGLAPAVAQPRLCRPGRSAPVPDRPARRRREDDQSWGPAWYPAGGAGDSASPVRELFATLMAAPRMARSRGGGPASLHGGPAFGQRGH